MRSNIELEEAQSLLLEKVNPVSPTRVPLWYAGNRIVSEDMTACCWVPAENRSAVDGYAVITDDFETVPPDRRAKLKIMPVDNTRLIEPPTLSRGTCIRVMTGDVIPAGATAVVKWENVTCQGDTVAVTSAVNPGENVVFRGDDVRPGSLIAGQGTKVTPAQVAVMAGQGWNEISVFRSVNIGVINTGDELLYPYQQRIAGKVYNTTLYGINARCRELGTVTIDLGQVSDQPEAIAAGISEGLNRADLVVITGGVSVGEKDMVEATLQRMGANLLFHWLAMKPGSPALAASINDKIVIGLSGNPAAALVSFELLTVPVIRKLQGMRSVFPLRVEAVMTDSFHKPSPQRRFLRGQLMTEADMNRVKLTGVQSNSVLMSMIGCNMLIDIPAGSGPVNQGQTVEGFLIREDHQF